MNFANVTWDLVILRLDTNTVPRKEHRKIDKNAKHPSDVKKKHDKRVQGTGQPGRAAQEIADDEVEIGKTGGKPGTENTPVTERKP